MHPYFGEILKDKRAVITGARYIHIKHRLKQFLGIFIKGLRRV